MHYLCKLSAFVLLLLVRAEAYAADDDSEPEEGEREFIKEQSKETQEAFKMEMEIFSEKLFKMLNQKLALSDSRMELMERSIANLSEVLKEKSSTSCTKMNISTTKLPETALSQKSNSEIEVSIITGAQELKGTSGTIVFISPSTSVLYHKHWMLQEPSTTSIVFLLNDNYIGPNYRLTITGISVLGEVETFYINSQTPNNTEFTIPGFAAVVALKFITQNPGTLQPNFALAYRTVTNSNVLESDRSISSRIITQSGLQDLSFPHGNTASYSHSTSLVILIAPSSAKEFKITLKYLELEDCCKCDFLKVFPADGYSYIPLASLKWGPVNCPNTRYCMNQGHIAKTIGHYTAAIIYFKSDGSGTGRGFNLEIKPM